MQGKLYKFGFTRKVKTERGKCYDVTSLIPSTIQSNTKPVKCDVCNEDFKSKQYLDQHVFSKYRHSTRPVLGAESSDEPIDIHASFQNVHDNKENECESSDVTESECVEEEGDKIMAFPFSPGLGRKSKLKVKHCGGSRKRRSYTLDFKVKILHLLDKLTVTKNIKNKLEKAASMMGLPNKCLVIKWNKDREKILGVLSNNRVERGTGNFEAAKQRQQLPSKKVSENVFHSQLKQ